MPNILISNFKKNENIKIISEISNVVQSLILSLSSSMSLYEAIKSSTNVIGYKRLKDEYIKFVNNYAMYNFNISRAIEEFNKKFNFYEFNMFLSILSDSDKDGNITENLEAFNETLEFMYFKVLKSRSASRIMFVSFSTIISLINILIIVLYPIAIQIMQNMSEIFK